MVEARVDPGAEERLIEGYPVESEEALPDFLLGTMLLHQLGSDVWRIVTLWRDRTSFDEYRRSGGTPVAVQAFQEAGAKPVVAMWEVEKMAVRGLN